MMFAEDFRNVAFRFACRVKNGFIAGCEILWLFNPDKWGCE
jgi:hypothetical protein